MAQYNLIGVGTNAKTIKGDGSEYITGIYTLFPRPSYAPCLSLQGATNLV